MPTIENLERETTKLDVAILGLGAILAVVIIRQAGLRKQLKRVEEHVGRVRAMNELEADIDTGAGGEGEEVA